MIVTLGEWTPDRGAIGKGQLRQAKNVLAGEGCYRPAGAFAVTSTDHTTDRPRGMASFRDQTGVVHTYVGDDAALYEVGSDGALTDRSQAGGYTATESTRWRIWQYGDRCLATNGREKIQYLDMSSGSAFADLPNATHLPKYGASLLNFVITGNDDTSAYRVVWSANGDSEGWTGGTNSSGEETISDGGEITGIASTEVVYIFQESAIRRMTFIGSGAVWQFDVVERSRGCIAPGTLAQLGRAFFFYAEDGFYLFDGSQSTSIGKERVDVYFKEDAQRSYYHRISSAVDPINKTYVVLYPSADSSGAPDTLLCYNWAVDRWTLIKVSAEILASSLSAGLSLDALDAIYGDLDSIPFSLDSLALAGGALSLGGANLTGYVGNFEGDALEAVLETDDFIGGDKTMLFAREVRPFVGTTCYVKMGGRNAPSDTVTYTSESANTARGGLAPVRKTARYLRAYFRIPAGSTWSKFEGFEIDAAPAGEY